jgi:hypothetical protein
VGIGAHNDMFSGGGYCAEKGERVLPRGIFRVPSFVEEDLALFCTRELLQWIEVVRGFPNAQTRCESVKSLMRYGEFCLRMMFQLYFRFSRKICTYDDGKNIIQVVSIVAIEWWYLRMIPTRLFLDLYNLQTFQVANPL